MTDLFKTTARDLFRAHSESLEEAQKRRSQEAGGKKIESFRMDKEGKYRIRILPNAPELDENGNYVLLRKGYEYPCREHLFKIVTGTKDGKPNFMYVNVRDARKVFPQLEKDLLDIYLEVVAEKYADDQALVKSIKSNSFSGGLKFDNKRYMYVINMDEREKGPMMMQLSYSQYCELEERKLDLWKELREEDPRAGCPISDVENGYVVEITRKSENGKTSYSFNINTRKTAPIEDRELDALMELPRMHKHLYRYTRYHLEATIAYLKQYEAIKDIDVLSDSRVKNVIDQIKMLLPSDDSSRFVIKEEGEKEPTQSYTLDELWDLYDGISESGLTDRSEEGQNLRSSLLEFIQANDLDVAISRRTTNGDILRMIEAEMEGTSGQPEAAKPAPTNNDEDVEDEEDDSEPSEPGMEPERNFDTNEPAARRDRSARPERRRR